MPNNRGLKPLYIQALFHCKTIDNFNHFTLLHELEQLLNQLTRGLDDAREARHGNPTAPTRSDPGDLALVQELLSGHYSISVTLLDRCAFVIALPLKWKQTV
jgi:hypothetical protein